MAHKDVLEIITLNLQIVISSYLSIGNIKLKEN